MQRDHTNNLIMKKNTSQSNPMVTFNKNPSKTLTASGISKKKLTKESKTRFSILFPKIKQDKVQTDSMHFDLIEQELNEYIRSIFYKLMRGDYELAKKLLDNLNQLLRNLVSIY